MPHPVMKSMENIFHTYGDNVDLNEIRSYVIADLQHDLGLSTEEATAVYDRWVSS